MGRKEPSKLPRKGWRRLAFQGLSSQGTPQSDVECAPLDNCSPPTPRADHVDGYESADLRQAGPTGQHQDARGPGNETHSPAVVPCRSHSQNMTMMAKSIKKRDYRPVTESLIQAVIKGSTNEVEAILGIFKRHQDVCHNLFREPCFGASVLHIALSCNEEDISRLLITKYPGLISLKYESDLFKNQTAFHIAASKGQCEMLDLMLQHCESKTKSLELLNTKANGTYFNEEHPAGALALTAAVWGGHCEMLGMLIENGAALDSTLYNGNTVLHCIVEQSVTYPKSDLPKKLFDEVLKKCAIWWQKKNHTPTANTRSKDREEVSKTMSKNDEMTLRDEAIRNLLAIRNNDNHNILSLAVIRRSNLTKHILNVEHVYKCQEVKVGALSWSIYDVTEVTSYPPCERICRYNPGSILHILGHSCPLATTNEDLDKDFLEEEPIRSLILKKWETYRFVYIIWCLIHFLLMVGLSTVSLYFHKQENTTAEFVPDKNATANATYGLTQERHAVRWWYLVFTLVPLINLILEIVDVGSTSLTGYNSWKSIQWKSYLRKKKNEWSATGNGPSRLILALFSVNVEIWICLHMIRSDNQDIPLSFAMVFGWLFMVFFTRACPLTCRFSVMMQKMFFHDCIYFFAIFAFFLSAFTTAMHVLLVDGARSDVHAWDTLYGMVNLVTDAGEKETGEQARMPVVGVILLSFSAVVSVILMMNMLIAMMNSSYEVVKNTKKNICRYQQLSIMLMFERRLWWWEWLCDRSQDCVMSETLGEKGMPTRLTLVITEFISKWTHPETKVESGTHY